MRLKYLGTAAAEAFPALFCSCEQCKAAEKTRGKEHSLKVTGCDR